MTDRALRGFVLKMAGYVQKRASEMTADKATHTLDQHGGVAVDAAARHGRHPELREKFRRMVKDEATLSRT